MAKAGNGSARCQGGLHARPTSGRDTPEETKHPMHHGHHGEHASQSTQAALDGSQGDIQRPSELLEALTEAKPQSGKRLKKKLYEAELKRLQSDLVKMQYWIKATGFRMIVLFEGRDAAGKGGTIKRLTEPLNPRGCRVVALGTPSDQQKSQWYFQRYVEHFPSAGEIVVFDRSWYNRAGVENVMGFCTPEQVERFLDDCPRFEQMLVNSGILLLKYWFSVSDTEQEARFQARIDDPTRRWKLSPMDLEARNRWVEFSRAKDEMFASTNIPEAPWFTVEADDKRRARLNCLRHVLSKVPWEDMTPPAIKLPDRPHQGNYIRPPINEQFFVPNAYPWS